MGLNWDPTRALEPPLTHSATLPNPNQKLIFLVLSHDSLPIILVCLLTRRRARIYPVSRLLRPFVLNTKPDAFRNALQRKAPRTHTEPPRRSKNPSDLFGNEDLAHWSLLPSPDMTACRAISYSLSPRPVSVPSIARFQVLAQSAGTSVCPVASILLRPKIATIRKITTTGSRWVGILRSET